MKENKPPKAYPTFSNFVWAFKQMLVCRYNWGVDEAAQFDVSQIEPYYNRGMDKYETYFTLFNVEQDLYWGFD